MDNTDKTISVLNQIIEGLNTITSDTYDKCEHYDLDLAITFSKINNTAHELKRAAVLLKEQIKE
jgi:hypothetical protein